MLCESTTRLALNQTLVAGQDDQTNDIQTLTQLQSISETVKTLVSHQYFNSRW